MPKTLKKRIERLEQEVKPEGFYIVSMQYGEDREEAIKRAGIEPGPNDLVVMIVKYRDEDFD